MIRSPTCVVDNVCLPARRQMLLDSLVDTGRGIGLTDMRQQQTRPT